MRVACGGHVSLRLEEVTKVEPIAGSVVLRRERAVRVRAGLVSILIVAASSAAYADSSGGPKLSRMDWSGFYIGLNAGGAWTDSNFGLNLDPGTNPVHSPGTRRWLSPPVQGAPTIPFSRAADRLASTFNQVGSFLDLKAISIPCAPAIRGKSRASILLSPPFRLHTRSRPRRTGSQRFARASVSWPIPVHSFT